MKSKKYNYIKDKFLYIPIILLTIYFIIRLINESFIIHNFPFDFANDISSHMAELYFLAEYGFHNIVPNWYNGFNYVLFRSYPPGWYFSALPLYYIFKNVQITTYISLLLMYIISFIAIFYLGKIQKISKTKRIAFFLFLFANPITIGYLLRLGKLPELMGWLLIILLFTIIIYFKDKDLNKNFLFFIPLFGFLLITNITSFLVFSPILISLFLIKTKKEKIMIILSVLISIILTSFWLIPFLKSYFTKGLGEAAYTTWLISLSGDFIDKLTTIITPLIFMLLFYFYWKDNNKSKKELIFFSPFLILALLLLTRLIVLIPIFNSPHPDNYNILFIFLSLYLLFKTKYLKNILNIINPLIYILVIISIIVSIAYTPFYKETTQLEKDTISLLPQVKGNLIILGSNESYSRAFYSYGAIYYNISTVSGWMDLDLKENDLRKIKKLNRSYNDCTDLNNSINELNIKSIITYYNICNNLENCGLIMIKKTDTACLLYTN